eukprot:TRINITY_DN571_c0_g2_i1.p1 TRINITY_DN571_c0_g2~~TRINITY_DN571_c0_g2_i1.p1  ORF type:complete len:270 (-),score=94.96 TRINITY_DN571_c0_g2_i1:369-1178(-)
MARTGRRTRSTFGGLVAIAAAAAWGSSFVAPYVRAGLRGSQVSRAASEEEEAGGFASFLKVEQDIELTQEEFNMALEQEMLAQRKKYYIGGDIKPNNLVVPWKDVNDDEIQRDARKALKKNGIRDPSKKEEEEEDSNFKISLVGGQDVKIAWTGGEPGKKVGYIIERKRLDETQYRQIASYEDKTTNYLLARFFLGHQYVYSDEIVAAGPYTYRVLVRLRSGEVKVLYQEDYTVPKDDGVPFGLAFGAVIGMTIVLFGISFIVDPAPQF